jgi:hypothetical protein
MKVQRDRIVSRARLDHHCCTANQN